MASEKKVSKPAKKAGPSKSIAADPALKTAPKAKTTEPVEELPSEEEMVEDLDTIAEQVIFGKNQSRTYALRDVWLSSLMEVVNDKSVPKESREEVLFLTLTNALLDMTMDVVPKDMALAYARNLDDFITVTLVNHEYDTDLLKIFRDDFQKKVGENFPTEEKLIAALSKFEEEWWNTPRKDLKGKTPNDALEDMAEKYEL